MVYLLQSPSRESADIYPTQQNKSGGQLQSFQFRNFQIIAESNSLISQIEMTRIKIFLNGLNRWFFFCFPTPSRPKKCTNEESMEFNSTSK